MADDKSGKEGAGEGSQKDTGSGDDVQALKDRLAALEKEKQEWSLKKDQDLSLNEKVKREREDQDRKASEASQLESALKFNLTSADFLKANESILPKEVGDIFKAADQEKYDSAVHKANATKAAIVQSFFSQQANTDLLTESQKVTLSDYLKLTKNAKEFKAREIYENLFEPALASLKRVKKAEELSRSTHGFRNSLGDSQYRERLMKSAKHHYLGEKA
jgi:hypothetical protein